jgi:hypothetical protein
MAAALATRRVVPAADGSNPQPCTRDSPRAGWSAGPRCSSASAGSSTAFSDVIEHSGTPRGAF